MESTQILISSTNTGGGAIYCSGGSDRRGTHIQQVSQYQGGGTSIGSGYRIIGPQAAHTVDDASVLDWLQSDEASQYEGKWVALDDDMTVRAHGDSPSSLEKMVDLRRLTVVFVTPVGLSLSG